MTIQPSLQQIQVVARDLFRRAAIYGRHSSENSIACILEQVSEKLNQLGFTLTALLFDSKYGVADHMMFYVCMIFI